MAQHTWGEIPDTFPTKRMLPLGEHIWYIYEKFGWEYLEKQLDKTQGIIPGLGDATNEKYQTAVDIAQDVLKGKIRSPEKVMSTWFFPPLVYIRSDLQTGSTKLIYGHSTSITFVLANDISQEIELLINAHCENGIPVDFWYISEADNSDIFERRHIKYGMKLKDVAKKSKDSVSGALRIIDILRDIRNERNPEFAQSLYSLCMVWATAGLNVSVEPSNFSQMGCVYDGIQAKRDYGMADYWFNYVPLLPLLNMMALSGRQSWVGKLAGLLTNNQLFITAFEPKHKEVYKERAPELWDYFLTTLKEKGVPTPRMSIECKPPDLKDKKTYGNGTFDWGYPKKSKIMPSEWGLTDDEIVGGIYTDITHVTPEKDHYGKEHVVSLGVGKE